MQTPSPLLNWHLRKSASMLASLFPAAVRAAGATAPEPQPSMWPPSTPQWMKDQAPVQRPYTSPGNVLGSQGQPLNYGLMLHGDDGVGTRGTVLPQTPPSAPAAAPNIPVVAAKSSSTATRFSVLFTKLAADTNLGRAGEDLLDIANVATGNLGRAQFGPEAGRMMKERFLLGAGGGALGGAGLGAIIHMLRTQPKEEENQTSLLGDTLRGGAAGGILGTIGGGLAAADAPRELWNSRTLQGRAHPVGRMELLKKILGGE